MRDKIAQVSWIAALRLADMAVNIHAAHDLINIYVQKTAGVMNNKLTANTAIV